MTKKRAKPPTQPHAMARSTRFPKGVSGNPSGRPKGSKNKLVKTHDSRRAIGILEKALLKRVKLSVDGRIVTMTIFQALIEMAISRGLQDGVNGVVVTTALAKYLGIIHPKRHDAQHP